jgi:hypothetical protein
MKQAQRRSVALLAVLAMVLVGCTPGWNQPAGPVQHGPILGSGDDFKLAATPELDSLVLLGLGSSGMLGYLLARRRTGKD